jgi:hypothetical protein
VTTFGFAALTALAVAGCGGGSSSSDGDPTTLSPSSTTESSSTTANGPSTTAAPKTVTSQASATAHEATITAADLPGYKQYAKAEGWSAIGKESCGLRSGSPLTTADHVYSGPQLQDPTKQVYVYTQAYVFDDAAAANQYANARTAKGFLQCKVAQDQTATRTRDPKAYVQLTDTSYHDRNVHSLYRELEGTQTANGAKDDQAQYDRYTYVKGPVVVVINIDAGLPTPAQAAARNKVIGDAFNKVVTTLDARLP